MKEKLLIPEQVQQLLNEINTTNLNLGEIQISEHPLLPSFNRFIRINKMVVDTELPRTYLFYQQVLRDKETHEIEPSNLPTPEWMIGEEEWSSLRDKNFNRIFVPVVDEETQNPVLDELGNPKTSIIKVNTHHYMLWLVKNNKIGFLDLLKSYLQEFVEMKSNELNKLS
ncbi:hypothetical protein [Chryseobacterium viscerum]|uniref:Uncharacterized protein n=1 Tax=Chryseobacterium viscerum TaxID=1037377 RepID=A0A316WVR9_9FLAO|nr:hypothetical protein [Chryseobacterium viscerum]KAB1231862.1 hypothetical protein F8D52_04290 [Chryseobacterium viscerum]PWN65611.1 hypothetical protein C1634_002385 [Chryseobacterium viscerum]